MKTCFNMERICQKKKSCFVLWSTCDECLEIFGGCYILRPNLTLASISFLVLFVFDLPSKIKDLWFPVFVTRALILNDWSAVWKNLKNPSSMLCIPKRASYKLCKDWIHFHLSIYSFIFFIYFFFFLIYLARWKTSDFRTFLNDWLDW
jgi:hypothetical protein